MSDDEDSPTSKLKDDGLKDPESGYSKLFKNKMESRRTYYIVLTLLIFIFAVLIIAVFGLSFAYLTKTEDQVKRICTTEDCLRSATTLVESMNKSADPCEDFYQFACGNFAKVHKIPKTAVSNDRFAEVHATMLVIIRDFMEKEDNDDDPYSVSQSRLLYRSCMATDEMNTVGIKQLVQILDQIGLPYMGLSTRVKSSSFSSILAKLKKIINLDFLFVTNVEADMKNRTANRISLGKPRDINIFPVHKTTNNIIKMSSRKMRETLASEEEVGNTNDSEEYADGIDYIKSYAKYFKSVWMEIYKSKSNNYNPNFHNFGIKVSQLLNFINEHSKIKDKIYDGDEELPSLMTVEELQHFTDDITQNFTQTNEQIIDWKQYFTILFMDMDNITLDFETDLIQISNIQYFEALFELISKQKNYAIINIWWEVVVTLLPYTTNEMRFIQDRYYYETTGLENNPSRSIYCANAVNSMMGMAVSRLLVDMESIYNNTKMAAEMIDNIHWAFEKIVKELNWMDDTTKKRTLYKAEQMRTFIGFPEFINDAHQLDDYYYDFEIIENDYFGNVIRYVQRELNESLVGLRQLNDYTINSWASDPLEVNAYNWIQANAITVPAGILQFPFFGHDLQMLNYGFLGSILGHELTHGFDNTGRKFDHNGNENMWWTNQTIAEYEKRSDCFIHHYESYLVPEIEEKISGKLTLDENIADNGGLREALLAYRKFVNDYGEEPKLPGFEQYSNEQMYYLAFANNWCEATTRESLSNSILDEHSPNSIRVIAGLTNSDEFSEIWNITELLKHIYHRTEQYERFNWVYHSNNNSSVSPDDNSTAEEDSDYWSDIEKIPVMSGIYMDYLFIITVSWVVLEFISNCCLKQSTFKRAPQKIYAWLVVYYGNLVFMALHSVHYLILMMRNQILVYTFFSMVKQHFGHFFFKSIYIAIISLEIVIIHSYYIFEEKNMLNDIIQLKWKYVSRGQMVSKGIDYSSSSTFNARTSGQTQEGSRIPPYITNIIQDN